MSAQEWKIGQKIAVPPEPPVGTILEARRSSAYTFRIIRKEDGWWTTDNEERIEAGELGQLAPVPWTRALTAWGPIGERRAYPFEIVSLPSNPPEAVDA